MKPIIENWIVSDDIDGTYCVRGYLDKNGDLVGSSKHVDGENWFKNDKFSQHVWKIQKVETFFQDAPEPELPDEPEEKTYVCIHKASMATYKITGILDGNGMLKGSEWRILIRRNGDIPDDAATGKDTRISTEDFHIIETKPSIF